MKLTIFPFPALIIASSLCVIGLLLPKELHRHCLNVDKFSIGLAILHKGSPHETD